MLDSLLHRLQHFHQNHQEGDGKERGELIKEQAEHACSFASEHGILATLEYNFSSIQSTEFVGAEHLVEFSEDQQRVVKITIPKGFGLTPALISKPNPMFGLYENEDEYKKSVELAHATPLEYLSRLNSCNLLFGDDIYLHKVIRWADQRVSFVISQPQYHGELPTTQHIEKYFEASDWKRIPNDRGHTIFFNYAFEVLAMDTEPRNCYITSNGELLPFDVILSSPNEEVEEHLDLYP